jgi:hypothetical protein
VKVYAVLMLMVAATITAKAQKVELAVVGGGLFSSNQNFSISAAPAIEGSLAYQMFHVPLASLYFELPIAAGLQTSAHATTGVVLCNACGAIAPSVSSLFVAPGLKLKLGALLPVSPFITAGLGVAHFRTSSGASTTSSQNNGVVQFGGGLDLKIAPFVGIRGEVRDYYSALPFFSSGFAGRQHNVLAGAGIVLRF